VGNEDGPLPTAFSTIFSEFQRLSLLVTDSLPSNRVRSHVRGRFRYFC